MSARTAPRALNVHPDDLDSLPRAGAPHKFAHVVFKTPRPQQMIDWYGHVLDAVVVFEDKRVAFLTYDNEHHRVAMVKVPRPVRIPAALWKYHRKFFGVDHVAFTFVGLSDLLAAYRRLANLGIDPVWCINHGPTTSMYYEDPDGNRVELQVDNFESNQALLQWMQGGEFEDNPIGVEFDPDVLHARLAAGTPMAELLKRGSAPPPGRRPRAGLRTIRWKTL